MVKKTSDKFKMYGDMLNVSFASFKDVLSLVTKYNVKTKNNNIILGKWLKKK